MDVFIALRAVWLLGGLGGAGIAACALLGWAPLRNGSVIWREDDPEAFWAHIRWMAFLLGLGLVTATMAALFPDLLMK